MGQRLNIEIQENEKVLANAYYHWSGFTSSALELTKIILNNFNEINYDDNIVKAVKLLETTGAGLVEDDFKYINDYEKYNFKTATNRNEGLINVSKKGIEDIRYWEEGRVTINIDSKTVDFNVLWTNTKEEYEENYEENVDELEEYDIDFDNITFNNFDNFFNIIINLINYDIYEIKIKDNNLIYNFIE